LTFGLTQPVAGVIQELMGHSSLNLTMDTYGHLWANPELDNHIALATELFFLLGGFGRGCTLLENNDTGL